MSPLTQCSTLSAQLVPHTGSLAPVALVERQRDSRTPIKLQRALGWQIRCATPSASAHPSTRRRWTVTELGPCLFSADLWRRRSTLGPSDSQPAATILQTESSRRSTTTDEKCHPRPRHRSAA